MHRAPRFPPACVLVFAVAAVAGIVVVAGRAGAAPDVTRPSDPRDRLLLERALRIGASVSARHVTPEGLLAYVHRKGATPEQLSADALREADVAIWTGCYAASLACRYRVTRDPAALAEARRVAAGLDLLSAATGVEGCICRSVGRPIAGEPPGKDVRPSPLGGGLHYRGDASRDQLAGIVLGWGMLARWVDDPEVAAYARKNLLAIARRLYAGKMDVRDADGRVTRYGRMDPTVKEVFGLVGNGEDASIGLAAVLEAAVWNDAPDLWAAWKRLDRQGWVDALDDHHTFLGRTIANASNWNMVHMALLCIGLDGKGKPQRKAMAALRDLRRATRGWQNGSFLACALLAGQEVGRAETVAELRETLLGMPAEEAKRVGTQKVDRPGPGPISLRPNGEWLWKSSSFREEVGREGAPLDPAVSHTRADYLFAYWLARAAGELTPP